MVRPVNQLMNWTKEDYKLFCICSSCGAMNDRQSISMRCYKCGVPLKCASGEDSDES